MKSIKYIVIAAVVAFSSINDQAAAQLRLFGKKKAVQVETQPTASMSVEAQLMNSYRENVAKRDMLAGQVNNLTNQMNATTKRSKLKKIGKQLVAAQAEYDAVVRILGTYPQSLTNPDFVAARAEDEVDKVKKELERRYEEKISGVDLESEIIEEITDPEIKRAYQKYQGKPIENDDKGSINENQRVYYSIQIGSGALGRARDFRGVDGVMEQNTSPTKSVYHTGKYTTESDARNECQKIRNSTRYRDAFIIAIADGKIVSINQARSMMR